MATGEQKMIAFEEWAAKQDDATKGVQ